MNQKGSAILFVMLALVGAGITTTTLLKTNHTSNISSIHYSNSESARLAVQSGFNHAQSFIQSSDTTALLNRLQAFADAANPDTLPEEIRFIAGSKNSFFTASEEISFRSEIIALDPDNLNISILVNGRGRGGALASALGQFQIRGIGVVPPVGNYPTNALQMDNGAFEFNTNVTVEGNTAVKKGMTVNAGTAHFKGHFRFDTLHTESGPQIGTIIVNSRPMIFDSSAYFAGACSSTAAITFKGNTGFDGRFVFASGNLNFNGDTLLLNAGAKNNNWDPQDMNSATIIAHRSADPIWERQHEKNRPLSDLLTGGSIENSSTPIATPQLLNIDSREAPRIFFDTTEVVKSVHRTVNSSEINNSASQITADSLNLWYDQNKDNLFAETFLIVRITGTTSINGIFKNDATVFTGKAIVIVDDSQNIVGEMVNTSSAANLTFYINNNGTNTPHFSTFTYLRGYVHIENSPSHDFVFQSATTSVIEGAVYGSPNARFKFDGGGSSHRIIRFNQSVIDDLVMAGVFNDPSGSSSTNSSKKFTLIYPRVTTTTLSRTF